MRNITIAIVFVLVSFNATGQAKQDSLKEWFKHEMRSLSILGLEGANVESYYIGKVEIEGKTIKVFPKYKSDLRALKTLKNVIRNQRFLIKSSWPYHTRTEYCHKDVIIVGTMKVSTDYIEIYSVKRWFH